MWVFAPALRRNAGDGSFQDLKQRLLHAFPAHIAGNGRVLALAGNFVDLINIDDTALCQLDIIIRALDQSQQDVFHILAHIARFCEAGRICNGKGDL